jgi:hypothetical protein
MKLKEQIASFVDITNTLTKANESIRCIDWDIKDVPYEEFEEFRLDNNRAVTNTTSSRFLSVNNIGSNLAYCVHSFMLDAKCNIWVYAEDVEFETNITVIKKQSTNINA